MKIAFCYFLLVTILCSLDSQAEFVLKEIPSAGHIIKAKQDKTSCSYNFNDKTFISIEHDEGTMVNMGEDTNDVYWTDPLKEILTLWFNENKIHKLRITIHLSGTAGVMRSRRAFGGEAILGQVGNPLIYGVPGLYDVENDALLEWRCDGWKWEDKRMKVNENGDLTATFSATISNCFMNFVFRPHFYSDHLGFSGHEPWMRRMNSKSMNGWCSWAAYHNDIDMNILTKTANFITNNFLPYGMNFMQADNGYMANRPGISLGRRSYAERWMASSKKFPGGPAGIAKMMNERGLEPGIWVRPDFFSYNIGQFDRDVLCRRPNGKQTQSDWFENIPDMSDYTITNYFVPLFAAFKDAGFKYVKVDGLRHIFLEGLNTAYEPKEARRRFRNFALAARLASGDDVYLMGCWGLMPELAGTFDACRISFDCVRGWKAFHRQLFYFAEFFSTQRIVFLNDPDHIVMHENADWARSRLSNISLGGGLLTYSDKNSEMTPELINILQRGLPSLETRTAECGEMHYNHPTGYMCGNKFNTDVITAENADKQLGPSIEPNVNSPFSTLWAIHIEKPYEIWCVAQRTAIWSLKEDETPLEKLGLDPSLTYLAYDFWKQKYLGEVRNKLHWEPLTFGHTTVVALREKLDRPQLIGSTRHVSMDAESVLDINWKEHSLKLKLRCVPNVEEIYSFHVPSNYKFSEAICSDGVAKNLELPEESTEILKISVKANAKNVILGLNFVKND